MGTEWRISDDQRYQAETGDAGQESATESDGNADNDNWTEKEALEGESFSNREIADAWLDENHSEFEPNFEDTLPDASAESNPNAQENPETNDPPPDPTDT